VIVKKAEKIRKWKCAETTITMGVFHSRNITNILDSIQLPPPPPFFTGIEMANSPAGMPRKMPAMDSRTPTTQSAPTPASSPRHSLLRYYCGMIVW
jgi:hypothetical protein